MEITIKVRDHIGYDCHIAYSFDRERAIVSVSSSLSEADQLALIAYAERLAPPELPDMFCILFVVDVPARFWTPNYEL